MLYNCDLHQVTIWVTITDTTPAAVADILNVSDQPNRSDSLQSPSEAPPLTAEAWAGLGCRLRSGWWAWLQ
jgi:hypothetical protein